MNGTLASLDNNDTMTELLLVMGENKEEPVNHIWISGRLEMSKDAATDTIPPWLAEEFTMDSPCMNLDRLDHLNGLVYGMPCDTAQYSVCVIGERKTMLPIIPSTKI
ncbi:putative odorant receptor 22c [Operophtera brumata]|uniref:Putative odorant receptor 22c n=1 Tax=Operophtera brumata TaxID=104452 RepID=A0A0L7KYX5_OPEBR|nr:putative odorant receptor 22c [Operophtera brumata]